MFGFILRNHKKGLVYNGDMSLLDSCLDSKEALQWRSKKPEGFEIRVFTGKIYGRSQKYSLPYTV